MRTATSNLFFVPHWPKPKPRPKLELIGHKVVEHSNGQLVQIKVMQHVNKSRNYASRPTAKG